MSNEIVERVARVMWREIASDGGYDEDRNADDREAYLAAARAAIEAMREPTKEMIEIGGTYTGLDWDMDRHAENYTGLDWDMDRHAENVWRAMIQAALA